MKPLHARFSLWESQFNMLGLCSSMMTSPWLLLSVRCCTRGCSSPFSLFKWNNPSSAHWLAPFAYIDKFFKVHTMKAVVTDSATIINFFTHYLRSISACCYYYANDWLDGVNKTCDWANVDRPGWGSCGKALLTVDLESSPKISTYGLALQSSESFLPSFRMIYICGHGVHVARRTRTVWLLFYAELEQTDSIRERFVRDDRD